MSLYSTIEWTDTTWNPVRGCIKVSPGCKNCYAETFAERFRGVPGHPYEHGFDPRLVPGKLLEPLTWSTPKTVFVNSMTDLFQEAVPEAYVRAVAIVMTHADWHTYQVLTKRADRMQQMLENELRHAAKAPNIWWGVSVEDRKYGVPRIELLRRSPARVRFLSIEPLLEDVGDIDLSGIHWVIVGGESGPGARPMRREWVERIKAQCDAVNALFFFKQWGGRRKHKHGRSIDGRTYDAMPERVAVPMPSLSSRRYLAEQLQSLPDSSLAMPL
jgi:protein gp37